MGSTLLVVLAVTPHLAAQTEFPGHVHDPGTPDHVHQLQEVGADLAGGFQLVPVTAVLAVAARFRGRAVDPALAVRPGRANAARAPPGVPALS